LTFSDGGTDVMPSIDYDCIPIIMLKVVRTYWCWPLYVQLSTFI